MQLRSGESFAVQGSFKYDVYAPADREPRVSMTVFVDCVMPLRQPPKPKKPKEQKPIDDKGAQFDDGIPFVLTAAALLLPFIADRMA